MRTEDKRPARQGHLDERMRHHFNQDSPPTARSSRSSSRSSRGSSYSSCDRSRSPSVSRRSRRRHSSRKGRRRYARSNSRSSLPVRRSYRPRSKSLQRAVWLSRKDKMELLNIAKENAAKILGGVDVVKLPSSVKGIEDQVKKTLESDTEGRRRADPVALNKTSQDKGEIDADVDVSKTSPVRKPINFSFNNFVAKPFSDPAFYVPESKLTSRADRVGNRFPYGQWIPVKAPKKR